MDSEQILEGLVFYVVFLFSTTLHEAAHAWAAKRGGDLTAYHGGQVTLDPLPHIRREPFGMVVLPLLFVVVSGWPFGYASAPYDPNWAARHPRRAAWMALAGPGANLTLVILAALVLNLGVFGGVFESPDAVSFSRVVAGAGGQVSTSAAFFVSAVFSLNLLLMILNLIPVPPLDGSGALPLLMSRELTAKYQQFLWSQPMLGWVGILVAWRIFDVIFHPIWLAAVNLISFGVSYG